MMFGKSFRQMVKEEEQQVNNKAVLDLAVSLHDSFGHV